MTKRKINTEKSKSSLLFDLYKDRIVWSPPEKQWIIDFSHNGKRIRKRSSKWIKSKKWLAEEELMIICEDLVKAKFAEEKTFDEVFEEHMNFKSARKISKDNDRYAYYKHIQPLIGSYKINEIAIKEITAFKNSIISMKKNDGNYYDNKTIDILESLVRQTFNYAEAFDYVDRNIMRRVPKFKTNRTDSDFKRRFVEYNDVLAVMDELDVPKYRAALAISLYTFMRPAEIFGLDFKDDLGDRLYHRQSYDSRNRQVGPPKNNKRRYIPIPSQLRKELDMYYESLRGYQISPDSPLIGITARQSKSSIDKALKAAIAKAGVPKFSWYDIRSTMITNSLIAGAQPYVIARNAGHSQTMTTDTYAQVDIDQQSDAIELLYDYLEKDNSD